MDKSFSINQFAPSTAVGDGVTTSIFFIQSLLRGLGYQSRVYASHIPGQLESKVESVNSLNIEETDLLLVHHSMGHDLDDLIAGFSCKSVLVYHNITPERFFAKDSAEYHYSMKGRTQLRQWHDRFEGAIGDSPYNCEELEALGYNNIVSLSMLLELDKFFETRPQKPESYGLIALRPLILSVGRVVENKRQHLQVEAYSILKSMQGEQILPQLFIVGGTTSPEYHQQLQRQINELGLEDDVFLPGKCSDGELRWLYQNADCYWCTSEHEGFCIPLVEAGVFELPVVAFASSNIPSTLGEAGLILDQPRPDWLAATTLKLLEDRPLQLKLKSAGKKNLQRYQAETLSPKLYQYLISICPSLTL